MIGIRTHLFALSMTAVINVGGIMALMLLNDLDPLPETIRELTVTPMMIVHTSPEPDRVLSNTAYADSQVQIKPPPMPRLLSAIAAPEPIIENRAMSSISFPTRYASSADDLVFTEEMVDSRPTALRAPRPDYPSLAARRGIQGSVVLRMWIDRQGRVVDVKVKRADPAGYFEESAIEAARHYIFSPALYKGEPVPISVILPFHFELHSRELEW